MNKCALCIPRPGATSYMIQQGYIDALRYLGWKVYVCNPGTKLGCRHLIEKHNISLIMTFSRYGVRQLPIQVINDNNVVVIVDALQLNENCHTIDGPYEFAHEDEPHIIKEINRVLVHTRLEPHLWSKYMSGWQKEGVDIIHLPAAGNLMKALPPNCSTLTDVAMVANFGHRQGIMKQLIEPLFKRIDLLGYSYQVFGDNIWQLAGLDYNGPLPIDGGKLSNIYATAKVCPNVHTETQVSLQACVNERSFMIPLCGGVQVSDNPIATRYLGQHCDIATSTTDFITKVIDTVECDKRCFDKIRAGVKHVAGNHTYFNRLVDLFEVIGFHDFVDEMKTKGERAAIKHCLEMDARLSAEERNISYG